MSDTEAIADALLRYLEGELGGEVEFLAPLVALPAGYDTQTFSFQLGRPGAPPQALVLRLFAESASGAVAEMEAIVQNTLADGGYPAPRVHWTCPDPTVLGGPFLVMDFLPGRQLLALPDDMSSSLLGRAHAGLHRVDPGPAVEALSEARIDRTVDWRFRQLAKSVGRHPQLQPVYDWLQQHRPDDTRAVICHGDFHKLNVLVEGQSVTGVLDWSAFTIAAPAFDVAGTIMVFDIHARRLTARGDFSPTDLDAVVGDYLGAYRAEADRPLEHLDYYRVLRHTISLAHGLEGRGVSADGDIKADLAAAIEQATGIRISPA